jgi:hypothetical protein
MKWKVLKFALSLVGQIRPILFLPLCTFSGPQCDSVEYRGSIENTSVTITESPTSLSAHTRPQMNTETVYALQTHNLTPWQLLSCGYLQSLLLVTIFISVKSFQNALGTNNREQRHRTMYSAKTAETLLALCPWFCTVTMCVRVSYYPF